MKTKLLLLTTIIVSTICQAQQTESSNNDTQKLTRVSGMTNIGTGFGTPYFGKGYTSTLPINPSLTIERPAFSPSVKTGNEVADEILGYLRENLTVGMNVTYAGTKSSIFDSDVKFNALYISGRTSYHLFKDRKINPYAGISLGYVFVWANVDGVGTVGGAVGGLGYGFHVGTRAMLTNRFGLYGELGYSSLSVLNLGATFKL